MQVKLDPPLIKSPSSKNLTVPFVALAIQFAILGTIGFDYLNLNVPIARPLIGFIYLTFIPGILILSILNINKLNVVQTLLYTVGLSISFLMLSGFFANSICSFIGVSKPFSQFSTILLISTLTLILIIIALCCSRDNPERVKKQKYLLIPSISLPILILLPLLSVIGTQLMNYSHNNSVIILLILVISIFIPLSVLSEKVLPKEQYPFAIFMISISLLYMMSLTSVYILGWDIHQEYHFANMVINSSYWNYSIPENVNGMLSVTILPVIYSYFLNIRLDQVFKIIYPIIFSLVPLGLYELYKTEVSEKVAFLSSCFLMSFGVFFLEMLQLCRQQIAELFFVLIFLLINRKSSEISLLNQRILIIIFAISIVVSHYGTSYILMFYLFGGYILIVLFRKFSQEKTDKSLTFGLLVLYSAITLGWYIYISSSSSFNIFVSLGMRVISSLNDIFLSNSVDPSIMKRIDLVDITTVEKVKIYLEYLTMSFIAMGILNEIYKFIRQKNRSFSSKYLFIATLSTVLIAMSIFLPYFASYFNMSRLYFQSLFFLSPFFVLGGVIFFKFFTQKLNLALKENIYLFLTSLVLITYLLFNTGFVYAITGNSENTFTPPYLENHNIYHDMVYIYDEEVSSANWLSTNMEAKSNVYSDSNAKLMVLRSYTTGMNISVFSSNTTVIPNNNYIYYRRLNIEDKIIERSTTKYNYEYIDIENIPLASIIKNSNIIYNNGNSCVYRSTSTTNS